MNSLNVNNSLFVKPTIGRSEYGRVKVALAPGKGFMDWLKLSTNKVLAKRLPNVDHIELSKHDKKSDCWVHLFGTVYDVTKYLDFHPGGIPELLRAAGRDATPLFNQYHAWVNYESMLKSCIIGPFIGDLSKLKPCLPSTISDNPNLLGVSTSFSSLLKNTDNNLYGSRIQPCENGLSIEHDDWTNLTENNVIISILPFYQNAAITLEGEEITTEKCKIRILVHHFWKPSMEYEFESKIKFHEGSFVVKTLNNSVSLTFSNIDWKDSKSDEIFESSKCKVERRPGVSYHQFKIISKYQINHNTIGYQLQIPFNVFYRIPVGHHISLKIRKGNSVLYRPYTPICTNIDSNKKSILNLMIKVYSDGICTPTLEKLNPDDDMEISDPIGDKDFSEWIINSDCLILLAAGSGITPMIDILNLKLINSREKEEKKTIFLIFNKTEKDIQTNENLIEHGWILSKWTKEFKNNDNFVIRNVLSSEEKGENSDYLYGKINSKLLRSEIPNLFENSRAFVCGPDGFNSEAKKCLEEIGLSSDHFHIFQG